MAEVSFTRSAEDRRRYFVGDLGTVRKRRRIGWKKVELITPDGVIVWGKMPGYRAYAEAVDGTGRIVGEYRKELLSANASVHWRSKLYQLKHDGLLSRGYTLSREEQPLVHVRLHFAYRRTPAHVVVVGEGVDAGLILFVAWVLQKLNADSGGGSGGG